MVVFPQIWLIIIDFLWLNKQQQDPGLQSIDDQMQYEANKE